ncbi:MAG: tetratricopeptide repeat protein [Treponema sp.]|jgi:tetratricopeptide (TPR) repeat protein|nr:tetratricopeptide repeat protein [Treponema sp.]
MENNEKLSLVGRINAFTQKNRKPIFISLGCIVALLVILVAVFSLSDLFRKKAISRAEEFNRRYEELRFSINEESSAENVKTLLAELSSFAGKSSGYAGGRAWSIIAAIYADKKEWAESEKAWTSAAKAAAKTYLAPAAYFNAGVAAEEQGKTGEAIALYTQSISDTRSVFPGAARAQFSIGRLQESLNDTAAAIAAYRAVISGWPADAVWTSLAHSRIIALEK